MQLRSIETTICVYCQADSKTTLCNDFHSSEKISLSWSMQTFFTAARHETEANTGDINEADQRFVHLSAVQPFQRGDMHSSRILPLFQLNRNQP